MINYYLIQNKYEYIKYNYPDIFDIKIYYIEQNYCQIIVKRLDSSDGWGLILELIIYDNYNLSNYDILSFGNSEDNLKICYFNTNVKLTYNIDSNIKIPNIILPRKNYLINNKYTINASFDANVTIYYINEYNIQVIIRRLDNESGWDEKIQIILYDNIEFRKEIIHVNPSQINYKIFFTNTKIKVGFYNHNYNQEIPKIILQTDKTNIFKNILHFNAIMSFIEFNPEFTYIFFNNIDACKFIKDNFSDEINYSYNLLVPGSFKADLLRYCFLYNKGGCYGNTKQILRRPICTFLNPNNTILLCKDIEQNIIINDMIFSSKNNNIMEKVIKDCIYNITNKIGKDVYDITGTIFFNNSLKNIVNDNNLILYNNIINKAYKGNVSTLYNLNYFYYKNFQNILNYKICVYPNDNKDTFLFNINNNKLIIKRSDSINGWDFNLKIVIIDILCNEYLINIGSSTTNMKKINIHL